MVAASAKFALPSRLLACKLGKKAFRYLGYLFHICACSSSSALSRLSQSSELIGVMAVSAGVAAKAGYFRHRFRLSFTCKVTPACGWSFLPILV